VANFSLFAVNFSRHKRLVQIAAVRQSATFRELRDIAWGKDLRQAERAEFVERFRNLLIAAGAAARSLV
jgi:hypothetical protein